LLEGTGGLSSMGKLSGGTCRSNSSRSLSIDY
jgi:hypothetical protein